jgi:hypothetical protein
VEQTRLFPGSMRGGEDAHGQPRKRSDCLISEPASESLSNDPFK